MNYLLPLYIDYLERPEVYEFAYLKANGILEAPLSKYSQNTVKKALKNIRKKNTISGPKLQSSHGPKGMKLGASHKPTPPSPKGDISKVQTKSQLATQRRLDDLKALQKKKDSMDPTLQKGKQKLVAKKTLAKKVSTMTHAQKVHAGKTAAKGSEFGQKVATPIKKVVGKKSPGLLKTIGKVAPKAGMYAAGAAAAYGGYKLYKRHLSKAAKACKGTAGAERTLCLQRQAGRG